LSIFLSVSNSLSIAFYIFFTMSYSFDGKYLILTGYIRPDTFSVFFLKYLSKSDISIDADVMMILKSFLFSNNSFTRPKITSILIVLSCASSITRQE